LQNKIDPVAIYLGHFYFVKPNTKNCGGVDSRIFMGLINIKRKTRLEKRYSEKMGMFNAKVTYIKKSFLGIPLKTLHAYRETYYGEVKSCEDCIIAS